MGEAYEADFFRPKPNERVRRLPLTSLPEPLTATFICSIASAGEAPSCGDDASDGVEAPPLDLPRNELPREPGGVARGAGPPPASRYALRMR